MPSQTADIAQKRTFSIESRNIKDMETFIAPRKQTEFVNRALRKSLDELKDIEAREKALKSLQEISKMRIKSNNGKDSVQLVRELREGRIEHLSNVIDGKYD